MTVLSRHGPIRARVVAPGIMVAMLVAIGLALLTVDSAGADIVGGLTLIAGHSTAALLMFRRSRALPAPERKPWRVMSIAHLLAVTGLVVVGAMGGDTAPVFGPADTLFLSVYVAAVAALALIAQLDPEGPPWGMTVLDVGVGAVAAAALVWEFALGDIGSIDASVMERFGLSLYPILDVAVIVGLFLVALRRSHYRFDARILLIAVGLTIQVVGDVLYLRDGINAATFQQADPRLGLFVLATAFYVAAGAVVDRIPSRREFPERDTPLWALIWPYLLAGTLVPLHVVRVNQLFDQTAAVSGGAGEQRAVLYALLLVGVLVVIRQLAAIRTNRARIEQQRRDLVSSVSHELRTPLTAVMGFLHVLEQDPNAFSDEERAFMMKEVTAQAQHMSRTVTDLITLARDGGSSMSIRRRPVGLRSLVARALADGEGATVTTAVADARVVVDADRMEQAIGHLLSNARRYSNGRVHLFAGARQGSLVIEVHDDGPGIPTRHLTSIWNQFERGTRRFDSSSPGLGMGLAIVRAVAAAHGGTAAYRPSPALDGSCFQIVIPDAVVRAPEPHKELSTP